MENLSNIGVISSLMEKYGFSFSKGLGQNFLINPTVAPRIAEMSGAAKGVGMIEIGTGFGVLTHELAKRAEKVAAIELDSRLLPVLAETLSEHDNVDIINADVLKTDIKEVIEKNLGGLPCAVAANLPYYITSPVIMYLLESRLPVKSITVMVQKEAGDRLCAKMGSRQSGAVTAAVNYYAVPELLFGVSRGSFMPKPNVDSCVIRLTVREKPPVEVTDESFFFKVIRGGFSQRRKTLVNSLSSSLLLDKAAVTAAVMSAGLDVNIRPEKLTLEDFAAVAENLQQK